MSAASPSSTGLAGVIELVYYGPSGVPQLRCRVPGGGRFIDNGDSTVTDTETKLMWEKKEAGGSGFSTCLTNIHGVDSQCTWRQAMGDWLDRLNGRFIFSQNEGGFAGYSDWRLPTVAELRTIVDCSFSSCVNTVFGLTAASKYWSSSSTGSNSTGAWFVDFGSGNVNIFSNGFGFAVRAVRGGP